MSQIVVRNRGTKEKPSWEYRFEAAKIAGKRKQISKSGFKTKTAAQKAGNAALTEYNSSGRSFIPTSLSVADMFDLWLNEYCKYNVSENTYVLREQMIRLHIKPAIGKYKASSITSDVIQAAVNRLSNQLAASSLRVAVGVLKQGFSYAERSGIINSNPAKFVTAPKNNATTEDKEIIVLDPEQVKTILDYFRKKPHIYYGMLIAYYTGLRIGEAYALTWNDIDFENKTISVNKSVKNSNKDKIDELCLGPTKTKSSVRTISIGSTLMDSLAHWKEQQETNKRLYGEYYSYCYQQEDISKTGLPVIRIVQSKEELNLPKLNFVCVRNNGRYSGYSNVALASKQINNVLGIRFTFHAFRHTHATRLIESGIPLKTVSERLGHANISITSDVYIKFTRRMDEDAVNAFERDNKIE